MPTVDTRTDTTIHVNPNPGGPNNDTNTELAIYKIEGTAACNGTGGSYIAANGSDNEATAVWQTETVWGTVTVTGLNTEKFYSFCVKARNADLVESAFSGSCQNNGGYIPLSGNYTVEASSGCTNRYVDGTNPSRYVCGVDNGSGNTNSAVMRLKTGTFTLLSTETFVAGSIVSTESGSLIIPSGAVLKVGSAMYAIDADLDGYPNNANMYVATTPPTNGRRKYLMSTLATADCNSADPTQNATCCIANGGACTADGQCCQTPSAQVCGTDADGDQLFSSALGHSGTCTTNTAYAYTDTNDSQACPTGTDPTAACNKCVNGAIALQTSSEDVFSECAGLDCDGGVTKYYSGWSGSTCYYMLDVSAANHVCDGAGACKTAAVQCAASSQGVSTGVTRTTCKTMVGCTGTTAGSLGNVASGSDTYAECAASYNACSSTCVKSGPDGNCNGSGACKTGGLSANVAANKVCSGGSEVDATTQALACDANTNYTCTAGSCSGYYRYSECNGSGSCDTAATTYYTQTTVNATSGNTLTATCTSSTASPCTTRTTCKNYAYCNGSGTCNTMTNIAVNTDPYNDCPAPGAGTECASGSCNGAGACGGIDAGFEGSTCAVCKQCGGGTSCVNISNGLQDTAGVNLCNAAHYRCNGSGACTAPTTQVCITVGSGWTGSTACTNYNAAYWCNDGTVDSGGTCPGGGWGAGCGVKTVYWAKCSGYVY